MFDLWISFTLPSSDKSYTVNYHQVWLQQGCSNICSKSAAEEITKCLNESHEQTCNRVIFTEEKIFDTNDTRNNVGSARSKSSPASKGTFKRSTVPYLFECSEVFRYSHTFLFNGKITSTRDLSSRTRSTSPAQFPPAMSTTVERDTMTASDIRRMCTLIRERLILVPSESPTLGTTAHWKRKDYQSRKVSNAKVRKEGLELYAVWENEGAKELKFPHQDMEYYEIQVEDPDIPVDFTHIRVLI